MTSNSSKTQSPVSVPASFIQAFLPMCLALATGSLFQFVIPIDNMLRGFLGEANGLRWFSFSFVVMFYVANYLGARVVAARFAHGVPLPAMYPADAKLFCLHDSSTMVKDPVGYLQVVRGHENFVEAVAIHVGAALFLALAPPPLFQPFLAGAGTLTFSIGRMLYATGYSSKRSGPNGRLVGMMVSFLLGTLPLIGQIMLYAAGFL